MNPIYGKWRGIVVDNLDPEKLRRLRVRVPALFGNEVTGWAWPCEPYGGLAEQGLVTVPDSGAGVWIEFEGGNPNMPIWSGTWAAKPGGNPEIPAEFATNYPKVRGIKTASGHYVYFDDTAGKERVKLRSKSGHTVVFEDTPQIEKILVQSKNGHKAVLDDTEGAPKVEVTTAAGHQVLMDDKPGAQKIQAKTATGLQATLDDQTETITITDGVNTVVWDKNAARLLLEGGGHPIAFGDVIRSVFNGHTHAADGVPPAQQLGADSHSAKAFTG